MSLMESGRHHQPAIPPSPFLIPFLFLSHLLSRVMDIYLAVRQDEISFHIPISTGAALPPPSNLCLAKYSIPSPPFPHVY